MKKLFITDLDGTLLDDQKEVPESTLKEIRKFSENNDFLIATGRNLAMIKELIETVTPNQKVICAGGAVIYDQQTKTTIFERVIDHQQIELVMKLSEQFNVPINLYSQTTIYYFEQMGRIEKLIKYNDQVNAEFQVDLKQIKRINDINEKINKMVFVFTADQLALKPELKASCVNAGLNVMFSANTLLDVLPPDTNKGEAIKYLANVENYETIYVAGDNENDIDMLKVADVAVVMENATDEIKKHATIIAKNNNDKGIEKVLIEIK